MKRIIWPGLSLALVLGLNLWLRAFPVYFPQLKAQAKDNYQDASGQTYLMEMDCWHWARYTDNVLRLGHPGDEVRNNRQFDRLSGLYLEWNHFLSYFCAFLYKVSSLVKPIPLYTFLFYLPLFFTAVFIIVLFLFTLKRWGLLAATLSSLFIGLAPVFLEHSVAGWFDTDILNLLFPLLIVWAYLKTFEVSSWRLKLSWLFISGLWVGLFCFSWLGWWFIFPIILLYEFYSLSRLFLTNMIFKEKHPALFTHHIISLIAFPIFSIIWIIIICGTEPLLALRPHISEILQFNNPLNNSIWPNVYSTVQELRKAGIPAIASSTGNSVLFTASLSCLLLLFLRSLRKPLCGNPRYELITLLTIWCAIMILASFRGIRFTLFLLIPLGISLGWMTNEAYRYFKDRNRKMAVLSIIIISIFLGINILDNGYQKAKAALPMMNDAWYRVLTSIDQTADKEAIINSWWDFGHWFKAIGRRRVIFDGHTQNTPQAYWMAKALLSNREDQAIAILRMLNNCGNKAFEVINQYLNDPLKSAMLLERILGLTPESAKAILSQNLSPPAVRKLMPMLFALPPKAYFIVDYTMPDKMGAISYLGNWDFFKVYLMQNLTLKTEAQILDYAAGLGKDRPEAQGLYREALLVPQNKKDSWISRRLKFSGGLNTAGLRGGLALFDNGLVYNPREQTAYYYSSYEKKYKTPQSLFIRENDTLKEISYSKSGLELSILILKRKKDYQAILLSRELPGSLFGRLYFLNGLGLKHFKPCISQKDKDGDILVYELRWEEP